MTCESVRHAVGGCTQIISGMDAAERIVVFMSLQTCRAHHGAHHMAVIGEGKQIAVSEVAIQCLRDQGVDL